MDANAVHVLRRGLSLTSTTPENLGHKGVNYLKAPLTYLQ